METPTLLPHHAGLHVDHLAATDETITLFVSTVAPLARCPLCGCLSERVHSRYPRVLQDLPWNRVRVRLHLLSRRFFCDNPACQRRIFTEPVSDLAKRYARKTNRLADALYLIGYALGGEAGARVAVGLGLDASPDTLLRRIRQRAAPSATDARVRVLGVDEWALRRGKRYGTILVDLERRCLLDLLPERSAESLSAWLKRHPEVEIVSRDRADVYAEGVRSGAPQAQAVADRWHLLKNLGEALEQMLARSHLPIRQAVEDMLASQPAQEGSGESQPAQEGSGESQPAQEGSGEQDAGAPAPLTAAQRQQQQSRQRRNARYLKVHALHREGFTLSQIRRQMGMSYQTLNKYLNAESCPYYPCGRRRAPSLLAPFVPYLRERWEQGCHNARQLLKEIQAKGYGGCGTQVTVYLSAWRTRLPGEGSSSAKGASPPGSIKLDAPSARSVRWWMQGYFSHSDPLQQVWQRAFLKALYARGPELAPAAELSEEFVRMLKGCLVSDLDAWVSRVQQSAVPELKSFARGLLQDRSSVEGALCSEWSNGQTEGQVNRLKLIKRSMYGRAKFDLLRARVMPMAASA